MTEKPTAPTANTSKPVTTVVGLDFANTAIALPGGQYVDLLGSPASVNEWLTGHGLAPDNADVQEMCATQLRALREHVRSLLAARSSPAKTPRPSPPANQPRATAT
ncbi:ABATE domain-containing protein [Kribbella kalugense]|uniref:Putative stress-induced transcription regulator n=1 Tax=Kribbella kalugense TaxID=2512221 RepID=A0A4R7ZWD6_9ACTN|nr:ABATE domain-containing protein [Kribbella kalugense]TDW22272.1 putative stress-induced transcription regulator [Kribbella kalugense]